MTGRMDERTNAADGQPKNIMYFADTVCGKGTQTNARFGRLV